MPRDWYENAQRTIGLVGQMLGAVCIVVALVRTLQGDLEPFLYTFGGTLLAGGVVSEGLRRASKAADAARAATRAARDVLAEPDPPTTKEAS